MVLVRHPHPVAFTHGQRSAQLVGLAVEPYFEVRERFPREAVSGGDRPQVVIHHLAQHDGIGTCGRDLRGFVGEEVDAFPLVARDRELRGPVAVRGRREVEKPVVFHRVVGAHHDDAERVHQFVLRGRIDVFRTRGGLRHVGEPDGEVEVYQHRLSACGCVVRMPVAASENQGQDPQRDDVCRFPHGSTALYR